MLGILIEVWRAHQPRVSYDEELFTLIDKRSLRQKMRPLRGRCVTTGDSAGRA